MVIRLEMEIWVIGKDGTKRGVEKAGSRGRDIGAAGFCCPDVC
jgi:hypothetical protein